MNAANYIQNIPIYLPAMPCRGTGFQPVNLRLEAAATPVTCLPRFPHEPH